MPAESNKVRHFKDLKVWQKSIDLVESIYKLSASFPKEEIYGMTSQIRRSAVSIPANIAEGSERGSSRDYIRFLWIALGSVAELETHLTVCERLMYINPGLNKGTSQQLQEIGKMINGLISSLEGYEAKKAGPWHLVSGN